MRETKRLGAAVSKLSIVICYPTIAKYPQTDLRHSQYLNNSRQSSIHHVTNTIHIYCGIDGDERT